MKPAAFVRYFRKIVTNLGEFQNRADDDPPLR